MCCALKMKKKKDHQLFWRKCTKLKGHISTRSIWKLYSIDLCPPSLKWNLKIALRSNAPFGDVQNTEILTFVSLSFPFTIDIFWSEARKESFLCGGMGVGMCVCVCVCACACVSLLLLPLNVFAWLPIVDFCCQCCCIRLLPTGRIYRASRYGEN